MEMRTKSVKSMTMIANNIARSLLVFALIMLVSACASTGGEKKQAQKVVKPVAQNCDGQNKAGNSGAQSGSSKGGSTQQNCLPLGVIQIVENVGVDPEVRKEFDQALVLLNQQQYAEGIRLLKAVTGKTSKFSAPYINLGMAYARTNELDKAEESFKKAIEISELHPVARNELGLVYRKTGRYQEARELYETLLAMYPHFLPARKNLGVLCDIYLQDLGCAFEQYEEYLSAMPEDEKVKIWMADVKGRM